MGKNSKTWDSAVAPFKHLITTQGEVGFAYNLLQEQFFEVFNLAMALERPADRLVTFYPYALAIWHVIQNDRVQRDLALTALGELPTALNIKAGIKRLKWAKKQTDDIAKYRNLIIHSPMQFRYPLADMFGGHIPPPVPAIGSISTRPEHTRRLRAVKTVRFWKTLRNDCLNLSDYVRFVQRQIAWRDYERRNGAPVLGALRAWPHKPRLPSIRRIKTIEAALKVNPAPPRRRKRPQSSGGAPTAKSSP